MKTYEYKLIRLNRVVTVDRDIPNMTDFELLVAILFNLEEVSYDFTCEQHNTRELVRCLMQEFHEVRRLKLNDLVRDEYKGAK